MLLTQPIGFVVALIGLMGKLELPPFDAPEGRDRDRGRRADRIQRARLALFHLGKAIELVVGLTLIARALPGRHRQPDRVLREDAAAPGDPGGPAIAILTRLRIDQTVGLWWRYGALLVLVQWLALIAWKGIVA